MKRVRFVGAGTAIDAFVDLPQFADAIAFSDQGQETIIGAHEIMPRARFEHDGQALGSHARIHDRNEYRVCRPELFGLIESIGAVEDARIFMTQVRDEQVGRYGVGHALHRRYRSVASTEISE